MSEHGGLSGISNLLWRGIFDGYGSIARLPPPGAAIRVMSGALRSWGYRRSIIDENLRVVFSQKGEEARHELRRSFYRHLAIVALELPGLLHRKREEILSLLTLERADEIREEEARSRLFLSGHMGNWELLALAAPLHFDETTLVVVQDQRVSSHLVRMRTRFGNELASRQAAARAVSRALATGGNVSILADQSASASDALVPLFGTPAYTIDAPARLALRYRPSVWTSFAVRQADGHYVARTNRLLYDDLESSSEGARTFMRRYHAALEDAVVEAPEQWLWSHRRWKDRPGVVYR